MADPAGYYQKVVFPRQNKAMARLLNKQLYDHIIRERKPDHRKTIGPTETEGSGVPPDESDKAGKALRLLGNLFDPGAEGGMLKTIEILAQQ